MKDIDPDNNYIPKIEKKLQQVMGLNAASVGMPVVIRAVEQRMKSLKMTAIVRYYNLLIDSTAEMKELIENVIIPETWFFRDKTPFDALKKYIRDQWKPANPNKAVQILSIPCSTGEEPYTIAMSLMDIGMKSSEFRIDGIDISRENLIKANNGSYTRNSFRGDNISFKDRYFQKINDNKYKINSSISHSVHFMQANLLANFKPRQSYYDIIFCRNLLIYFDKPTQEKAITVLDKLLHKEGIIFVGHAETGSLKNFSYTSAKYIKAFAFKKNTPQKKTTLHQKRILNKTKKSATKILKSTHQYDAELSSSSARTKLIPLRDKNNIKTPLLDGAVYDNNKKIKQLKIEDIFILADNGDLITAEQQCNELLKTEPNAQAYYLLGIIKESAGDSEQADKSLRKAIYLNPNHYEALIHLSSIMKKQGNTKESNALFERAGRIQKRT